MLTCFIHNWEYYYAISVKFCRKVHAEWHGLCLLDYKKKIKLKKLKKKKITSSREFDNYCKENKRQNPKKENKKSR